MGPYLAVEGMYMIQLVNIKANFAKLKALEKNIEGVYFGGLHTIIKLTSGVLLSAGATAVGNWVTVIINSDPHSR